MILCIISWAALPALVAAIQNIRADIAFNDRFDITNMVNAQNQYFDRLSRGANHNRRANKNTNLDDLLAEVYKQHHTQLGKENLADWYLSHLRGPINYRRKDNPTIYPKIVEKDPAIRSYINNLATFVEKVRRSGSEINIPIEEFSFHETEKVENGGQDSSYEKNLDLLRSKTSKKEYRRRLQKYVHKLHGVDQEHLEPNFRRSGAPQPNPEEEVFLHNAFPFKLKIIGYLKEPSNL